MAYEYALSSSEKTFIKVAIFLTPAAFPAIKVVSTPTSLGSLTAGPASCLNHRDIFSDFS